MRRNGNTKFIYTQSQAFELEFIAPVTTQTLNLQPFALKLAAQFIATRAQVEQQFASAFHQLNPSPQLEQSLVARFREQALLQPQPPVVQQPPQIRA
jgi:hypothetical protein